MVRQDGEVYEHEVSKGDLHLEERDGSLKIYLPRDEAAWEDCFLHALPIRLLSWMMTPARDTEAAVGVVMSILTCSESSVLSLLRRKGVPEIDTIEEPLPVSRAASPRADLTEDGSSSLAQLSLDAPYPSAATLRPSLEPGLLSLRSNASSHHVTTRLISLSDHTFERALPLSALDEEPDREVYLQLLASVIAMAETVARRDYGSTAEVTALLENLSLEADEVCMSASALRNYLATTQGRHNKVGAAGELFVSLVLKTPPNNSLFTIKTSQNTFSTSPFNLSLLTHAHRSSNFSPTLPCPASARTTGRARSGTTPPGTPNTATFCVRSLGARRPTSCTTTRPGHSRRC
jgi:hypothetical protein